MATDYNEVSQNPRINYRSIFTPYSDKTHFIYELVQNADDNKSRCIELQLYENELLVWNDGCQFTEGDVRSICSIGFSNKDLTQIGTFGMGFKAVYAYTDNPEVYSGDERFRILINNPTRPEGIDIDDIDTEILEQTDKGNTVFRLPFREALRQEEEIARLQDRLSNLEKRALLFLRNLKKVQWHDENSGHAGSYSCHRSPHDKIQNASKVKLRGSLNGKDKPLETFLVFRREVQPPQTVIDELLQLAEGEDERQRIQESAKKLQSIEVAFKLPDGKITAVNNCVLFSYFPTQKETHLQFFIQASYKTTLARDNIEKDNRWNEWLIQETANFLPEVLEKLKAVELLDPAFFNVLPLKDDNVPDEFLPIAEGVQKAMQEKPFVPIQDNIYAKAENVFYPHRDSLRELIEIGWLYPNSSWLHPEIRNTEEFRRCFKIMREAGVKEIEASQVLDWLEQQDCNWFESRCEKWLSSLYIYLNNQKSEVERIKKLPLVRLENGKHVCANNELVFFPPNADEAREEIKPFLNNLPILQAALLIGEEGNEIEAFLKNVGVKPLRRVDMILEGICPQYLKSTKPSAEENRLHVRYVCKVWNDVSESERSRLKARISEIPILQAYKGIQGEVSNFVVPCDAYLPKAYTGNNDLEIYFSVYDEGIWFVDEAYLDDKSDVEGWLQFLRAAGTMDTPLVIERNIVHNSENDQEFNAELAKRDIVWEYTRRWKTSIEDLYLQGLPEALDKVSKCGKIDLSQVIWRLLVKIVKPLPSEELSRNNFFRKHFQGTYRWFYYSERSKRFEATFYRQLKSTAWIPDKKGNLHMPSECFAPIPENRKLLGDSVVYLPEEFDISTEPAKWLVEKLGGHLKADSESVLNHLQKLRSDKNVSSKKVEPLYRFLYDTRPRRKVDGGFGSYMVDLEPPWRAKFKKEHLIFIPEPKPHWWSPDNVFWEDESVVFGEDRGYLKSHYAKGLQCFFTTSLAISERAAASNYVNRIQEVKSMGQTTKETIQILYERLWQVMQENDSVSSNRLDMDPCEKFTEESFIFAPNPERCWWRVNDVFWEDEGVVFGDDRGYLKAYYPETLKPFFIALGIPERAASLDYVAGIKEVASLKKAENPEIRKRIKRLYSRVWQSLQEGGVWQNTEEWEQTREGRYWIGKKGNKWGFFSRNELVWNDHHDYIADIFEGEIPFWGFDDLLGLAKTLEIEGCSEAKIIFHPEGDQEEDTNSSEKVRDLRPHIHAFLNSPRLCDAYEEGKSTRDLDSLSVYLVEELETIYTLKGISLSHPNPRESFLDVTNEKVTLWLALRANTDQYAWLIGDALQDYFGNVKELSGFVEDLLTKSKENVLTRWKQKGLQTNIGGLSPEEDSKESEDGQTVPVNDKLPNEFDRTNADTAVDESDVGIPTDDEDNNSVAEGVDESEVYSFSNEGGNSTADGYEVETPIDSETAEIEKSEDGSTLDESESPINPVLDIRNTSSPDTQPSTKTDSGATQNINGESESETPMVNESPEIDNGYPNSATRGSSTRPYTPPRTNGPGHSGGHSLSTSGSRIGGGGHGGSGGGGEGEEHDNLKRDLANNPSQLGEGLELIKIEYTFGSGDRVDILLKDSSDNPVTVEVETGFSYGTGRYVGVWQAVKYQHLAAMEYDLECRQVRSILAAPEIPDDVKEKCKELGIEPFEVPHG